MLNQLGVACKFSGRFQEAEQAYDRALPIAERYDEPDLVATLLHNVGGLAHSRHQYAAGIAPAQRGLALRESIEPPDPHGVGADCGALAALHEGAGELEDAEALYRRAIALLEECGEEHEAAMAHNGLGSVCQALERWDEAREHYEAAARQLASAHPEEHPSLGHVLNNHATLHRRLGEDTEARALLAQALGLLTRTLGPDHPVTLEVAGNKQRVDSSPSPYV